MKTILLTLMFFWALTMGGCSEPPGTDGPSEVVAYTPRGGIVRFSGVLVGGVIQKAQDYCLRFDGRNAVPIGFYKIGIDTEGRDQIMTFECK